MKCIIANHDPRIVFVFILVNHFVIRVHHIQFWAGTSDQFQRNDEIVCFRIGVAMIRMKVSVLALGNPDKKQMIDDEPIHVEMLTNGIQHLIKATITQCT